MLTRQHLPAGLDALAPGPALAAVLGEVEPARLVGMDAVRYLRACFRQHNHTGALLLAAAREAGLVEGPDTLARAEELDDWSPYEASAALSWSTGYARGRMELADRLARHLPAVHAAHHDGLIDEAKVRAFSDWTLEVPADLAREVARVLLPDAPRITVGRLVQRIQQVLRALDPEWAARREAAAVGSRRVTASRNPSGSADLAGEDLPLERVVRANARIHRLAGRAKHVAAATGQIISVITLRADVFLGLLDGSWHGLDDDTIVKELLDLHRPQPGDDPGDGQGPDDSGPDDSGSARRAPRAPHDDGRRQPQDNDRDTDPPVNGPAGSHGTHPREPEAEHPEAEQPEIAATDPPRRDRDTPHPDDGRDSVVTDRVEHPIPVGAGRYREPGTLRPLSPRECLELRVRLSTVLGLDDHPGELPGWGPVGPALARDTLDANPGAEWRIAVVDDRGHLLHVALTRRRPRPDPTHPPPRHPIPCAVVELHVPLALAHALDPGGADPSGHGRYAGLVTDVARIVAQPFVAAAVSAADAHRRFPTAALARWVEVRDRHCVGPMCTRPARACDLDHTLDHALGGLSTSTNLGCDCRRCHRLKHVGRWRQTQPTEGVFRWTARSGTVHHVPRRPVIEPLPEPCPSRGVAPSPPRNLDAGPDAAEPWAGWDNDPHPTPPEPPRPEPPTSTNPDF